MAPIDDDIAWTVAASNIFCKSRNAVKNIPDVKKSTAIFSLSLTNTRAAIDAKRPYSMILLPPLELRC